MLRFANKKRIKGLLILSILLFSICNSEINNFNESENQNNDSKFFYENLNDIKEQDLSFNNTFSDIGAPWNLTHWANRTDKDLSIYFDQGSYGMIEIPLGIDWEGYKLRANIYNLFDERNWNNGSFSYGTDDGSHLAGDDDTSWISNNFQNWTFGYNDTGLGTNPMSGNYRSSLGGHDCLELRMDDDETVLPGWSTYDPDDRCWWNSSISIPRGKLIDSTLNFDLYPDHLARFNSWAFSIYLNNQKVYSIGTFTLRQYGAGSWHSFSIPQGIWINSSNVFSSSPLINSEVSILFSLECVGGGNYSGFENDDYQSLYVDNVELITSAEALPSNLQLIMNQTYVQDVDWGKGSINVNGNWQNSKIYANFSSYDVGELGTYTVSLTTGLNLFAQKKSPDTNYETNAESLGTKFSVTNESSVSWECFAYIAVPTGYSETQMKIEFQTDIIITDIFEPENPSTDILDQCDNSTPGQILIPVNLISLSPDGFWKILGKSPNYCTQLKIYSNSTSSWIENSEFLSGNYINITAKISNTPQISGYIDKTKAKLQMRFPNGTLWEEQSQFCLLDSNGNANFIPIQIPSQPPNYEVGQYEIIVTWNNSHSGYCLNETGIIYKRFSAIHDSSLVVDPNYYSEVKDGSILNLKVYFNDLENNDAIENAVIYTYNYTHPLVIQYFSEVSPGYYFLEFNVTGAPYAGENILMIYANSSKYLNKLVNITIDIIKNTAISIDNDYFPAIPYEQNFTIQFNYTEKYSRTGISTNNLSTDWSGEYQFIEIMQGVYNLTCNASGIGIQPNTLYSLIIFVEANKYQPQSIAARVYITEKASYLELYINGTKIFEDELVSIEYWQKLNITVRYTDAQNRHLPGATVKLVGSGISKDFGEDGLLKQYVLTLNASELGLGIHYLSIFANLTNYNPSSTRFISEITKRKTLLQIYLNGENKTMDPSIDVPIGSILNITVKYNTLSGIPIENALVWLLGAISGNLTEDTLNKQYTFTINTSILDIGIRLITVSAELENYELNTEDIRVEVRRIRTNITTENGISKIAILSGEDVSLGIILYDLDFGGMIKGAIVSYNWRFGSGFLTDNDNDGIYRVIFENVPEGSYVISINAYFGDDYEFEIYEVVISAVKPTTDIWLILLLAIIAASAATIIGVYIVVYQKVLKYPKTVRKVRKYRKTLRKEKQPKVSIISRESAFIESFQEEKDKTSKFLKGSPVDGKLIKEKMFDKAPKSP